MWAWIPTAEGVLYLYLIVLDKTDLEKFDKILRLEPKKEHSLNR